MNGEERVTLLSPARASSPPPSYPRSSSTSLDRGGRPVAAAAARTQPCKSGNGFNFVFLRRFGRLMRLVFPSLLCKSTLLLALLILAQAAEEYNIYLTGLIPSHFFFALDSKDLNEFKNVVWTAAVTITAVCICKSAGLFLAGLLYVRWRRLITTRLHRLYFQGINYYYLNITDGTIDNPDQRITQDVDKLCNQFTQILPNIILSPAIIAYYTYKTYESVGYLGPVVIYGYFVVSTVVNKFIMGPITSLIVRQEKMEGDFRFHHMQVRSNAESIAFYQGGKREAENSNNLLKVLLRTQLTIVHWLFPLNISTSTFDYASALVSYCIVGVAILSGTYDHLSPAAISAVISKNAFITMYLLNSFSTIVDTAVKFSDIAGYTHRVGQLLEVLMQLDCQGPNSRSGNSSAHTATLANPEPSCPSTNTLSHPIGPVCVEVAAIIENLSVAPPHQSTPLIEGLNMTFKKGKNVLIIGDSGSGKSSILRVLRGLWSPLHGHTELCCDGSLHYIMFLPQKPYLTRGTLADQVAYPEKVKPDSSGLDIINDNRLQEAVSMAGLAQLRDRLGGLDVVVTDNWYDIVSPGEMQKIGFSRLFYHRPPFAVLDEATSSLTEGNESMFYTYLKQLNITVLSVGHRSTLEKFHVQRLILNGSGGYQLMNKEL